MARRIWECGWEVGNQVSPVCCGENSMGENRSLLV